MGEIPRLGQPARRRFPWGVANSDLHPAPEEEDHQPGPEHARGETRRRDRGAGGGPRARRRRHGDGHGRSHRAGARSACRLVRREEHHACRRGRLLRAAGGECGNGRHRHVGVRPDDGLSRRQGRRRLEQSDRDRLPGREPAAVSARHVHVECRDGQSAGRPRRRARDSARLGLGCKGARHHRSRQARDPVAARRAERLRPLLHDRVPLQRRDRQSDHCAGARGRRCAGCTVPQRHRDRRRSCGVRRSRGHSCRSGSTGVSHPGASTG